MAVSEALVANLALSHVGAKGRISSLTENSAEARRCNQFFETARDATLRGHDWNFARKYVSLAALLTITPPDQWTYIYAYPDDCIRARFLENSANKDNPFPFEVIGKPDATTGEIVGRSILANVSPAILRYTARVTAPEVWDPGFVTALSWRLAVDLAMPTTGKSSIQKDVANTYATMILLGTTDDANEGGPVQNDPTASWISGRA